MTSISLAALLALSALLTQEPTAPELKGEAPAPQVRLAGYAKVGYFFTGPGQGDVTIGGRNGFRLANVRFGLVLTPVERLEVVASLDGSVARRRETDPLDGSRVVDLKDAYLSWSAHRLATLRAGQFKAPYNAESLLGDGALPFISRSVVSEGILPPEGFPRTGLALDRQVGLEVSSERLGSRSAGLRYAVALVNGNGPNALNNDNNAVAPMARLSFELRELLTVSVNGYYNQETEGVRPFRLSSNRLGLGADLTATLGGLDLVAVVLARQTTHPELGGSRESALGLVGWARYLHRRSGLEGGIRLAHLEPSSVVPEDRLTEISAMAGYRVKGFPLRVVLQYTLRVEEPAVSIDNNSLDALAQVSW